MDLSPVIVMSARTVTDVTRAAATHMGQPELPASTYTTPFVQEPLEALWARSRIYDKDYN